MNAQNYVAWQIDEKDFPKHGSLEQQIKFLAGYGILAPSTHNTQPWLFSVSGNKLELTLDPKLSLPGADPVGRGEQISLGAFVANIEAAASVFKFTSRVEYQNNKIIMGFKRGKEATDRSILKAIKARFSDKRLYNNRPIKPADKQSLERLKKPPSLELKLIEDQGLINSIANLQAAATQSYMGNKRFFKELGHWLKNSNTKDQDGMPGFVVGLTNLQSQVSRKLISNLKPAAKVLAKKDHAAILSSSMVGVISTKQDDKSSWFEAGRFYELICLEAAKRGMAMTPLAAMIEKDEFRQQLKDLSGSKEEPQIFFRIGYSKHKPYHTPRRPLNNMETLEKLTNFIKRPVTTQKVRVGKYDINYIVAGQGKPVLLLHGANIGWAQWHQNIEDLAGKFKVYALDLPGAGDSSRVDFHKTDFSEDYLEVVKDFIKALDLAKLSVVGSSFGGWIALKLAIENHPKLDKVVISNPLGFTKHMPIRFRPVSVRAFAKFLSKTALKPKPGNKNLEKFMRDVFFDKELPLAREFIDYFYELSASSHNILFISRLAHLRGMRPELFLADGLSQIKVPVRVIWGKEDPLMPFKTVENNIGLIRDVDLKVLEKVGHMPPVEVPKEFNRLTIEFLE